MATITPTRSEAAYNVEQILWETLTSADTATAIQPAGLAPLAGSVQATGTFGGATITMQISNDNTNWATLKDATGAALTFSAAGIADFSTSARYIRPSSSGGTSDDVDVTMILRSM